MWYQLLRPLLFQLNPEAAHTLSLRFAGFGGYVVPLLRLLFARPSPKLSCSAFGLTFANPLGLAAGYDKDGIAVDSMLALGFGHVELGTVTRAAQVGNPAPRLHRITESQALVNALGFPNSGIDALQARLAKRAMQKTKAGVVGINIGKSKSTPLDEAALDYVALLPIAAACGDYVTINVSSPNTAGLRELQHGQAFDKLLQQIARARELAPRVPVLVKIAPDMESRELDALVDAVIDHAFDGIIATNTTSSRAGISAKHAGLSGGMSGAPLRARSLEVVKQVAQRARGKLVVVAAGGVATAEHVLESMAAGAELVQMYSALVYLGPGLPGSICYELTQACRLHGCQSLGALCAKLNA